MREFCYVGYSKLGYHLFITRGEIFAEIRFLVAMKFLGGKKKEKEWVNVRH